MKKKQLLFSLLSAALIVPSIGAFGGEGIESPDRMEQRHDAEEKAQKERHLSEKEKLEEELKKATVDSNKTVKPAKGSTVTRSLMTDHGLDTGSKSRNAASRLKDYKNDARNALKDKHESEEKSLEAKHDAENALSKALENENKSKRSTLDASMNSMKARIDQVSLVDGKPKSSSTLSNLSDDQVDKINSDFNTMRESLNKVKNADWATSAQKERAQKLLKQITDVRSRITKARSGKESFDRNKSRDAANKQADRDKKAGQKADRDAQQAQKQADAQSRLDADNKAKQEAAEQSKQETKDRKVAKQKSKVIEEMLNTREQRIKDINFTADSNINEIRKNLNNIEGTLNAVLKSERPTEAQKAKARELLNDLREKRSEVETEYDRAESAKQLPGSDSSLPADVQQAVNNVTEVAQPVIETLSGKEYIEFEDDAVEDALIKSNFTLSNDEKEDTEEAVERYNDIVDNKQDTNSASKLKRFKDAITELFSYLKNRINKAMFDSIVETISEGVKNAKQPSSGGEPKVANIDDF